MAPARKFIKPANFIQTALTMDQPNAASGKERLRKSLLAMGLRWEVTMSFNIPSYQWYTLIQVAKDWYWYLVRSTDKVASPLTCAK